MYIGGLIEYISKKVAAYGQFVLVFNQTKVLFLASGLIESYTRFPFNSLLLKLCPGSLYDKFC